ncbi:MAG: phage holin family protein [Firmicutes bacterium]|nr:phage holin family protein [Bacillota bacterium]
MEIMQILGVASVPFVVAVVHELLRVYKMIVDKKVPQESKEAFVKLIPLFAGVLGLLIGVGAYFVGVLGDSLPKAILVGIASGLGATGIDQVAKQLGK